MSDASRKDESSFSVRNDFVDPKGGMIIFTIYSKIKVGNRELWQWVRHLIVNCRRSQIELITVPGMMK